MQRWIAIAVGLALTLGFVPETTAAPAGDKAAAKKLFEKGEQHYQQSDFGQALKAYKAALKKWRHPAFLFNIAQCYRQLKNYSRALFYYRLFLSENPRAANRAEVKKRIRQMEKKIAEAAALKKKMGRLSIISEPEGAAVRVDRFSGPAAGTTPVILKLPEGDHLVQFQKPGYEKLHKTVTVKAGRLALVKVTLKPVVGPRRVEPRRVEPRRVEPRRVEPRRPVERRAVTPDPTPRGPKSTYRPFWKRWWFWTGAAVATVAIGLGSMAGVFALRHHDKYLDTGEQKKQNEAYEAALVADVLIFGGAAVAVATIVGAIVVHMRYKKSKERARGVTVLPSCGPGSCGVALQGRF